ncbi:MAG TPA: hypothetical protein VI911_00800 [Patescibacteria group bacterium]|nr:hypothetical protein [Patescibacteria group bacterium]
MIDPNNITNYNQTTAQLQESLLFWVCAAGKNGKTAARCLETLLNKITHNDETPFNAILTYAANNVGTPLHGIDNLLRSCGIGCYNNKAKTFIALACCGLDLKKCAVEDLEKIHGIGMKTARCFIIHSRKNANCAGLDTHILKFMRLMGFDAPKATPTKRKYLQLEQEFVKLAYKYNKTVAELDLEIWNHYSAIKNITA